MPVRGVRGATVAEDNQPEEILRVVRELLREILDANPTMQIADLASAFFTTTHDLDAIYPAAAARQLGWDTVPLICGCEIDVPGSLSRCIRVLLHWNTDLPQTKIKHVYLGAAKTLRPDLAHDQGVQTQNTQNPDRR